MLTVLVWLWCLRLGSFLYLRISECGEDKRFKDIRVNRCGSSGFGASRAYGFCSRCFPCADTHAWARDLRVSPLDILGVSLWVIGYVMEVTADYQKTQFRRDESKKGRSFRAGSGTTAATLTTAERS
ncbi:Protein of unknown function DUF1295 [Phytophthora cactorum]|nr:Protein of unknown function DUF1295 [Phytophthora cactorum]